MNSVNTEVCLQLLWAVCSVKPSPCEASVWIWPSWQKAGKQAKPPWLVVSAFVSSKYLQAYFLPQVMKRPLCSAVIVGAATCEDNGGINWISDESHFKVAFIDFAFVGFSSISMKTPNISTTVEGVTIKMSHTCQVCLSVAGKVVSFCGPWCTWSIYTLCIHCGAN